jgi:uncharacterized repeat protein (TIGR01451 family)
MIPVRNFLSSISLHATILVTVLNIFSPAVYSWFDCNWYYRSEVTITENSGSLLSDYQVLLELDSASFHTDYSWSSAGQDLRILEANDSSQLDFFIQSWDAPTKRAKVWVKIPSLPANSTKMVYLYYGNPIATTTSTATITLTEPGIKFHTRNSTANPNNKIAAFNFFNAAADGIAGYGCKFVTDFTNIKNKNQFTPSTNKNFAAYSETFFEVLPAEVGLWSVRYGADFGHGGGLYIDDVALEEDWNNDLWWQYNWNNADVLQGSINLSAGFHRLEVIGFEGCCDGGITVQFKKPGSTFKTYSTNNINIVSRKCPTIEPSSTIMAKAYTSPQITIKKTSQVVSDPINLDHFPKRIPGSKVRYTITVSNTGSPTDLDSVHIDDPVPANSLLQLGLGDFLFEDGSPSSGLSFNYLGSNNSSDDMAFSNNNGTSFLFQPTVDADNSNSAITSFQISPKGRLSCSNTAQPTSFSFKYEILLK